MRECLNILIRIRSVINKNICKTFIYKRKTGKRFRFPGVHISNVYECIAYLLAAGLSMSAPMMNGWPAGTIIT